MRLLGWRGVIVSSNRAVCDEQIWTSQIGLPSHGLFAAMLALASVVLWHDRWLLRLCLDLIASYNKREVQQQLSLFPFPSSPGKCVPRRMKEPNKINGWNLNRIESNLFIYNNWRYNRAPRAFCSSSCGGPSPFRKVGVKCAIYEKIRFKPSIPI